MSNFKRNLGATRSVKEHIISILDDLGVHRKDKNLILKESRSCWQEELSFDIPR